jgi:hypothetical protein
VIIAQDTEDAEYMLIKLVDEYMGAADKFWEN